MNVQRPTHRNAPTDGFCHEALLRIADPELILLALQAVQDLELAHRGAIPRSSRAAQTRTMLTLLAYCYARGLYGSQAIHQAIRDNPTVRYLCAREFPDGALIKRFRRRHRKEIAFCLQWIFERLWNPWLMPLCDLDVPYASAAFDEEATIRQEIEVRLELAAFIDRNELDDA